MITFDTNILVYAADRDAGDRHERAAELVERAIRANRCIQPLQTLCEFFNVATRKAGIAAAPASALIAGWQAVIPVEPATPADLNEAIRAVSEHQLAFWDAMLWATARRLGVRRLVSEDFQDGRTLEGVRIVNPFLAANEPLLDRELPQLP